MNDLELKLKITADGRVAVEQLGQVARATGDVGTSAESALSKFSSAGNIALSFDEISRSVQSLLGPLMEGAGLAEAFTQLQARLTLATKDFGDAGQAVADVQRIAQATGTNLGAVGDLYIKTGTAAKTHGINQAEVASITETVGQTFRVAGATGSSAAGAASR